MQHIADTPTKPSPQEPTRWPRSVALAVVRDLLPHLQPACERLVVAGSLRRKKPDVGDIELVYISKVESYRADFFESCIVQSADDVLAKLIDSGVIAMRPNIDGRFSWGPKNKLAIHCASGIPIDFFSTTQGNWWNYLVCRTGPKESNIRIATAAEALGWRWNPYGSGFSRGGALAGPAKSHDVASEREVFDFVGLPYLQPHER